VLRGGSPRLGGAVRVRSPTPVGGGLGLWTLLVSRVDATRLDLSVLDVEERGRAARMSRPQDRLSFVAAHILLRQLLSQRLGVAPREIAYLRESCPACGGPHGRPVLAASSHPLHFSVSRRDDVVLIGLAATRIGVDVEALAGPETIAEVGALLHARERAEVVCAAPSEQPARFTRIWARKEAYLKGVGVGIAAGLSSAYLGAGQTTSRPLGWMVLDIPAPAGYAAAAALAAPGSPDTPLSGAAYDQEGQGAWHRPPVTDVPG